MKFHLFTYGTLMCEDIFLSVTELSQHSITATPAILNGYRRCLVRGECFPAITSVATGSDLPAVEGVLYKNVPEQAWEKLDDYEGDLYYRDRVDVIDINNNKNKAMTYIIKPDYKFMMTSTDWDLEDFLQNNKSTFIT